MSAVRSEAGQGLAEYALILGLIACVAIVALMAIGANIVSALDFISTTL